jgi:hypothetical protein
LHCGLGGVIIMIELDAEIIRGKKQQREEREKFWERGKG